MYKFGSSAAHFRIISPAWRGGCTFPGQVPYPGHIGNHSWHWSIFSKILTESPSQLNGLSCEVLSPCDRRGIYAPKKKNHAKVQKVFFFPIFVECQRACSEATSRIYCPELGTKKKSISEMKICRFIAPKTNKNILLQLKRML